MSGGGGGGGSSCRSRPHLFGWLVDIAARAHLGRLVQTNTLELDIWRGDRDGHFEAFSLPRRESQTILDAVTEIQRTQDASLAYRFACRVGMCGSCAMVVNGRPRRPCRPPVDTLYAGPIKLEPLRNLPIVKDLAVDMAPFFDKWRSAH